MTRYTVQVAFGFAVGGFIAALGMNFSVGPSHYHPHAGYISDEKILDEVFSNRLLPAIGAFSLSGAIGGAFLRKGWNSAVGFAVVFGVLGGCLSGLLIWQDLAVGGCTAFRDLWACLLYPPVYVFGFSIAGAIGPAIGGLGPRLVRAGGIAFGVAGVIGFVVYVVTSFATHERWIFLPLMITHALGGALLAVAAGYPSHKH